MAPARLRLVKLKGWSLKHGDKSEQREGGRKHLRLVQLLISCICELCPPVIMDQNASNCNIVFLEPRTWHYLLLSLNYKIWTSVSLYCTKKPYFFMKKHTPSIVLGMVLIIINMINTINSCLLPQSYGNYSKKIKKRCPYTHILSDFSLIGWTNGIRQSL